MLWIPGMGPIAPKFHDFLGYNPHTHILVTDGCFYGDKGMGPRRAGVLAEALIADTGLTPQGMNKGYHRGGPCCVRVSRGHACPRFGIGPADVGWTASEVVLLSFHA